MLDYIMNGQATGSLAQLLLANNLDPWCMKPFIGSDGRPYINKRVGNEYKAQLALNADASLTKDAWILLDQAVIKAAKPRLGLVNAVRGAGLQYVLPNGMAHTVLQHQTQSDITPATISMDGVRDSDADQPEFSLENLPLPIIHKDFHFTLREVLASRQGMAPLDTTTAELASRRCAEEAEKLLAGTASAYAYGGGVVYGLTNYPSRLTNAMTTPTGTTASQALVVTEVQEMKTQSQEAGYYGPWFLFASTSWDAFLDADYSTAYPSITLRDRLERIEGVDRAMTLDYLPANTMVLVQKTPDVLREVVGMEFMTVQWESHGGLMLNFKVMGIMVPQLRKDFYGNTGIVHGSY